MATVKPVTSYVVIYSANGFRPRLALKDGKTNIGQLVFHPDGSALPPDQQAPSGYITLHYHLQDFSNVLDLLRNEKPLSVVFSGSGGGFENTLQTGPEPVGTGDV